MKWIISILVLSSWALAASGVALWLFMSMFNDSPSSAATFQKIIGTWLNLVIVSIAVTIAVFLLKDPKWKLVIASGGIIVSLVIFWRPFAQIGAIAEATRKEAQEKNSTYLEELRVKVVTQGKTPFEDPEADAMFKSLSSLIDSQGEKALEVLRLAVNNGAIPARGSSKGKEVFYPGGETKTGDEPILHRIVYSRAEILKIFLEAGADPNETDTAFGMTPLMRAAAQKPSQETLEKVKLLLKFGARVETRDALGKTARDHALWAKEDLRKELDFLPKEKSRYSEQRRQEIASELKISDEILSALAH